MHNFLKSPKLLEIDQTNLSTYIEESTKDPKHKAFYAAGVQEDEGGGIEIIFHFADIYQYTAHYCYCIKGYLCHC